MKSIVFCADDYGLNQAVDSGILQLVKMGRLSAFSCMTHSPRWEISAKAITQAVRNLADIGLHLDFTEFNPSLRMRHERLIVMSCFRLLDTRQLIKSIHLQFDQFERALGCLPDYIDGHQHVHQLPQIRNALMTVIKDRYKHALPWIRIARAEAQGFKARIITSLGAQALADLASEGNLVCTEHLLGVYDFDVDINGYYGLLDKWLAQAALQAPGTLTAVMCHPAASGQLPTARHDSIAQIRRMEFKALSGDGYQKLIEKYKLTLIRPSANPNIGG